MDRVPSEMNDIGIDTTVLQEIEESKWESQVGRWKILKVVKEKGSGVFSPSDGSICCISIKLISRKPEDYKFEMTISDCELRTMELGEGSTTLDIALEYSIQSMKSGEFCHTTLSSYKDDNCIIECCFSIILHSFTEVPQIWEMTGMEKLEKAECLKADGVKYYNEHKIESAFGRFSKAVKILITVDDDIDSDIMEKCKALRRTCYLNIAACQLQTGKYNHVVANCDKVLKEDPDNMKALYRRGTAFINLQEYDRAKEDLTQVLRAEKENSPAKLQMLILKEKIGMQNEYYKKAMMKMFKSY